MIRNAFERGGTVYVEDERGRTLYARTGRLEGYTAGYVTVREGGSLRTFDERGLLIRSVAA